MGAAAPFFYKCVALIRQPQDIDQVKTQLLVVYLTDSYYNIHESNEQCEKEHEEIFRRACT